MNIYAAFAAVALLATTSLNAEARDRWRYRDFAPWHNDGAIYLEDDYDEDEAVYYDDEEDEIIIIPKRKQRIVRDEEGAFWWLEDGARQKLDQRAKSRHVPAKKPVVKKASVKPDTPAKPKPVAAAAKPKPALKPQIPKIPAVASVPKQSDPLQTASIAKAEAAVPVDKPKAKPVIAKPAPARVSGKTIGCSAGAAVIVGYGFADVKPKACTGEAYAYTALRAGKTYEIKLTAASGEITDVKKVN